MRKNYCKASVKGKLSGGTFKKRLIQESLLQSTGHKRDSEGTVERVERK